MAAIFVGFSLLNSPVPGVNEPHYLCKARAFTDPDWCSRDFFLQSANAHAVFLCAAGFFTQFWSMAAVALAGRVVSGLLLGWGWCRLTRTFGLSLGGSAASAAVFCGLALTGNFSGEWVLGGFESKVPAWGLAFAATACWISRSSISYPRSWRATGCLLGASIALHPVVGGWFVIGIGMSTAAEDLLRLSHKPADSDLKHRCRKTTRGLALMTGIAGFVSLPGLIPSLRVLGSTALSRADQATADQIQVFIRLKHHLDPTWFSPSNWMYASITLVLIMICSRVLRESAIRETVKRARLLLLSACVIAAVGTVTGWHQDPVVHLPSWCWRAFLLKFYPFRFVDCLLPMILAMTLTAAAGNFLHHRRRYPGSAVRLKVLAALMIVVLVAAFLFRRQEPGGYSPEAFAEWKDACAWIRRGTRIDALVLTPRESAGFKWYAERAEYVCYKDCPQDATGILEWYRRLQQVDEFRAAAPAPVLSNSSVEQFRLETGITHIVTREFTVSELSPVYENPIWRVYELPKRQ